MISYEIEAFVRVLLDTMCYSFLRHMLHDEFAQWYRLVF